MGRKLEHEAPPATASALASMLGMGEKAPPKVAAEKAPPKMHDPCREPGCKGRLTDLSRATIEDKQTKRRTTLITLICSQCNKVQGQAAIPELV